MVSIKPLLSINLSSISFIYKACGLLNLCFVFKAPSSLEIHVASWNSNGFTSIVQLQQTSMANLLGLLQHKLRSLTRCSFPGNRIGLLTSAHKFFLFNEVYCYQFKAKTVFEGNEHVFKMMVPQMGSWAWSLQLFLFILTEANSFATTTETMFNNSLEQVIGYIMGYIVTKIGWAEVRNDCEECFLIRIKNMGGKQTKHVCNEHSGVIDTSGSFKRFFSRKKPQIIFSNIWTTVSSLLNITYSKGYQSYQNQCDDVNSVDLNVNLIDYVLFHLDMKHEGDIYRLTQFSDICMVIEKERESLNYRSSKREHEWELSEKRIKRPRYCRKYIKQLQTVRRKLH
jgi:hypothetical protein